MKPQMPGHAPGWKWIKDNAGEVERPWAWSEINGGEDLPAHVNGLCELGWHTDCPQAPLTRPAGSGQCSCPCHHQREDRPMTHVPTPEEFLAQTEPDEDDTDQEVQHSGLTITGGSIRVTSRSDPLESIASSLGALVEIVSRRDSQDIAEDETRQSLDQLDAEYAELERLHDAKQQLIEDVLLICKPSTSKLANAIRAVLEPVVAPPPAAEPVSSHPMTQPVPDADVEEWRNYARQEAPGATDVDQMNRSQIRTLLGISHVEGASS